MVVTKVLQIKTSRNLKRAIDYITRDNATLKLDTEHLEGDENYSFEIVNGKVMKENLKELIQLLHGVMDTKHINIRTETLRYGNILILMPMTH